MHKIKKFISEFKGKRKGIVIVAVALIVALVATAFPVHLERDDGTALDIFYIGLDNSGYRLVIGNLVSAQEADYTCDGSADDATFQAALDALPDIGGQLFVLAGSYNWTAATTVTRAIDNVSIIGVGASVYFDGDGSTPIFTAGGDKWLFSNLQTDAGSLEMGVTSNWMWLNVFIDGTFYAIEAPDDPIGGGDVAGPSSSTDNAIVRFDGATGKIIQDYTSNAPTISDTGDVNIDGDLDVDNIVVAGTVDGRDVSVDGSKLNGIEAGADVTDATNVNAAGAVMESDYDAQTILIAILDNTPVTLTVNEQQVVGRLTGGNIVGITIGIGDNNILQIDAADAVDDDYVKFTASGVEGRSYSELRSDINVEDGADVTDATNVNAAGAVMESDYDAQTILQATSDNTPVTLTINEQEIVGRLTGANIDGIAIGIADNNMVQMDDADAADNDYAKFTVSGLEGRSYSEVLGDLSGQAGASFDWGGQDLTNVGDVDGIDISAHDTATTGVHGVGSDYICAATSSGTVARDFVEGWTSGYFLKGLGVNTDPTQVYLPEFTKPWFHEQWGDDFTLGQYYGDWSFGVGGTASVYINTHCRLGLSTGTTDASYYSVYNTASGVFGYGVGHMGYWNMQWSSAAIDDSTVYLGVWGSGDTPPISLNSHHVGFKVIDGSIYTTSGDDTAEEAYDTGIDYGAQWISHDLWYIVRSGYIEFYIDGVKTNNNHTTRIPTFTNGYILNEISTQSAADKRIDIRVINIKGKN